MKLKLILSVGLLVSTMCACSSMEEPKYSCNPDVDEWVKDNMDDIHTMTRANWLESEQEFHLPIYRAFTPKQRVDFWREKFNELKKLNWSKKEMSLIIEAEDFFESHLSLFGNENPSESQLDEVELFVYKWREKAQKTCSWSDEITGAIIASGEKIIDNKGHLYEKRQSVGNVLLSTSETCNCHVESYFTCMPYENNCESADCIESSIGCGGFLLFSCDGRCKDPVSYNNL